MAQRGGAPLRRRGDERAGQRSTRFYLIQSRYFQAFTNGFNRLVCIWTSYPSFVSASFRPMTPVTLLSKTKLGRCSTCFESLFQIAQSMTQHHTARCLESLHRHRISRVLRTKHKCKNKGLGIYMVFDVALFSDATSVKALIGVTATFRWLHEALRHSPPQSIHSLYQQILLPAFSISSGLADCRIHVPRFGKCCNINCLMTLVCTCPASPSAPLDR